jgi:hypothetical protein
MSVLVDDIVVNPAETGLGGVEASLSEAGLSIIGANFGESVQKGTAVKTATGIVMVDREPETRTITLKLIVRQNSEVTLPEAAYRLEQIVGHLQARDSWIRRDFHLDGDFGSLLYHVSGEVTLADFAGWQVGDNPDVTLTMVCDMAAYSTEEVESEEFKEEVAREFIETIADTPGTADGLECWHIGNLGLVDWRGLIFAKECRDYAPESTAEPAYEARNLTPLGGAEAKEVEGAKVVQHTALNEGWTTILNSEISGVGHMTHVGARRVWMRVYDPGEAAGGVKLRLLWRALGASRWSEDNPVVSTPLVDGWALIDLGAVRPQVASLGDQRWEFKLMARAPSGSGAIRIRDVYPLPTEQYLKVAEPNEAALDGEPVKTPGTAEDNSGTGSLTWSNVNNAKVEDGSFATVESSSAEAKTSHYLKLTNFGFTIPTSAVVRGITVTPRCRIAEGAVTISPPVVDARVRIIKGGTIKEAEDKATGGAWDAALHTRSFGGSDDLWGNTWTPSDINGSGFGVALSVTLNKVLGGTLKAEVDVGKITIAYTEGANENRVCFASRSLEVRSTGVYRQHPEDDVWGRVIEDGFPPVAVPSGVEGRATRVIVIPTQGDLEERADSGTNKLSAVRRVRAGHHYSREAA